jgi:hypothetical protein
MTISTSMTGLDHGQQRTLAAMGYSAANCLMATVSMSPPFMRICSMSFRSSSSIINTCKGVKSRVAEPNFCNKSNVSDSAAHPGNQR